MEAVFSWVKNIVIFFLVLTLLEEILPDSDYKKYIRTAAGMVFILIVFSPLLKLFGMDRSMDYFFQWESVKNALVYDNTVQLEGFDEAAAAREKEAWVLSQYKENLKAQIQTLVENQGYEVRELEVSVEEDSSRGDFGSIKEIALVLREPSGDFAGAAAAGGATTGGADADGGSFGAPAAKNADSGAAVDVEKVERVAPVEIGGTADSSGESPGAGSDGVDDKDSAAGSADSAIAGAADDAAALEALLQLLSGNYGIARSQISITLEGW